jgi:hypothetical protein
MENKLDPVLLGTSYLSNKIKRLPKSRETVPLRKDDMISLLVLFQLNVIVKHIVNCVNYF